jgi:hypothetical protein
VFKLKQPGVLFQILMMRPIPQAQLSSFLRLLIPDSLIGYDYGQLENEIELIPQDASISFQSSCFYYRSHR